MLVCLWWCGEAGGVGARARSPSVQIRCRSRCPGPPSTHQSCPPQNPFTTRVALAPGPTRALARPRSGIPPRLQPLLLLTPHAPAARDTAATTNHTPLQTAPPGRRPHDTSPLVESCPLESCPQARERDSVLASSHVHKRERDSVLASLNTRLSSTQQVVCPPFKGHRCNRKG